MTRSLSIRVRTALAFAGASMVLTAAVLVFVNLASQQSFARSVPELPVGPPDGTVTPHATATPFDPATPGTTATPFDPGEQEGEPATLRIAADVAVLQWQWSAVGIVAAGVLAGGVGWLVSRRMLGPIDRITETTTRISASNLHERIDLDGPDDELRRLSRTIDALLDRLDTAFESQRRFVAQASHELRTPLAVQRAALQIGLPDGASPAEVVAAREELLEQNRRTEHLVESLLVLAEADRGLDDRTTDLDLATIADDVTHGALAAARRADVTLACRTGTAPPGGPAHPVRGEPTLVRQLLANLVDNAIEYNEPGGFVAVLVDADGLTVENSGPVVAPEDVAGLLEPFRRGGTGGTHRHSGLGLSIVAAVARAHGWALTVVPRADGGLRVHVGVSSV
ncbi:sensor histidine kinase [Curtobacterium pusillum]|uniref:sensor histidine kinase n=1 Tax=Curtobacterium pusillum TaxID=69373 RepID=UPI00119D9FC6|nr:HAMP domain-containing sensor histidine kinase [Curtobacterium pusillum]